MSTPDPAEAVLRKHLRNHLGAHMASLGYKTTRSATDTVTTPEIVRRNPVRGRIAYGETLLSSDFVSRECHERLQLFSKRRTRRRSSILFFIAVGEKHRDEVESLLGKLGIVSASKGGHVHVVLIPAAK